jgi:MtN3 and saliva related transmembrane protein
LKNGKNRPAQPPAPLKENPETMDLITLLGICAGTLTTVSFVPQVLKTWQMKSAKDVSLVMFIVFSLGITLWIVYGFKTNSLPVIVANSVTLVLAILIIIMKLKFK